MPYKKREITIDHINRKIAVVSQGAVESTLLATVQTLLINLYSPLSFIMSQNVTILLYTITFINSLFQQTKENSFRKLHHVI